MSRLVHYTAMVKAAANRRQRMVWRAAMILALAAPAQAIAKTYHVAPGGDDRAQGTRAHPWQTLIHAVSQLAPGDTLMVAPGHYRAFHVQRRNSGTPEARVRIIADKGAVIDPMLEQGQGQDGINVEYASYIDIEGFTITNAPRAGIRAVECQGVRIRKNEVSDSGRWGIFTAFCDEVVIEQNIVSGSRREHGIYVSNSTNRPIIRQNHIFGNAMCGIHTNGDRNMGRDGMTDEALIEGNIIHHNGRRGGAAINNDGLRDSIIQNNLIHDNYANGITLYRIDGKHPSTKNKLVHNTIIMPGGEKQSRWCIRIADGSTHNVLKNNICINGHQYRGAFDISEDSLPGLVSDHNLIDGRFTLTDGDSVVGLDEWRSLTGQDRSSQPIAYEDLELIFVNPARGDYRPKPGGPAVGRGDPRFTPPGDGTGRRRQQRAPDLGALELCDDEHCTAAAPPGAASQGTTGRRSMDGQAAPPKMPPCPSTQAGCMGRGSVPSGTIFLGLLGALLIRRKGSS